MDYEEQAQQLILTMVQHMPKGKAFKTDEFSQGEVKMLEYLYLIGDGMTAGELSEKLGVSTARIARMLKALEGKNLLHRAGDKNDKRKVLVFLTDEGKISGKDKYNHMKDYVCDLFTKLGEEDTKTLLRLLHKIGEISVEYCSNLKESGAEFKKKV